MPRRQVEDIVLRKAPQRPPIRTGSVPSATPSAATETPPPLSPSSPRLPRERKSRRRFIFFAVIALVILGGGAYLWERFGTAVVTLTPKTVTADVEAVILAHPKGSAAADELSYDTIIVPEEALSRTLVAHGTKEVEKRASGEIIIFNSYNSQPQRLIERTRFMTPDGKIFRIEEPIVVPGATEKGGTLTPGSVVATVYADEPGKEYNIELTDFTIPGFKGDPRYSKFYARSKTPMTGGFVGTVRVVDEGEREAAVEALKGELGASLGKSVSAGIPEGSRVFSQTSVLQFEVSDNASGELDAGSKVDITVTGRMWAFAFNTEEFDYALARAALGEGVERGIQIADPEKLEIELLNRSTMNPASGEQLSLSVQSPVAFISPTDLDALRSALAGIEKDSYQRVFFSFPSIESAEVRFSPSWRRAFPDNAKRIKIETVEPRAERSEAETSGTQDSGDF